MNESLTMLIGIPVLTAFFLFEAFYSEAFKAGLKGEIKYRNLAYAITSLLVLMVVNKIAGNVKSHISFSLDIKNYPLLDIVGCFLVAELLSWIFHYVKHQGYFWRFHYQHHLDEKYSVMLTAHTHGLEVIISGTIIGVIMHIIGFSLEAINTYYLFYMILNTYQHSSFKIGLGPLDKLIVSPAYHRIHHSKSYRANYGSTLTIWDIVFGTARWPKENEFVSDIGIQNKGEPIGFWKELIYCFSIKH